MFNYDPKKLNKNKKLGSGAYGSVFPYQKSPTDDKWVVKCIYAKTLEELQSTALKEIVIGFNLDHPSVLPIRGYYIQKDDIEGYRVFIKMPRMQKTLAEVINEYSAKNQRLPIEVIIKYFHSLASGLEYLEGRRIAHRDIKPANMMLDKDGNIKLMDVGLAKNTLEGESSEMMSFIGGTPLYMAPELFDKKFALKKKNLFTADVWSLGEVIAELCLLKKKTTWPRQASPNEITKVVENNVFEIYSLYKDCKEKMANKLVSILSEDLLCIDPSERKSFKEIRENLEKKFPTILNQKKEGNLIREESKVQTEEKGIQTDNDLIFMAPQLQGLLDYVILGEESKIEQIKRAQSEMTQAFHESSTSPTKHVTSSLKLNRKPESEPTKVFKEDGQMTKQFTASQAQKSPLNDTKTRKLELNNANNIIFDPKKLCDFGLNEFQDKWKRRFVIDPTRFFTAIAVKSEIPGVGPQSDVTEDSVQYMLTELQKKTEENKDLVLKSVSLDLSHCYQIIDTGVTKIGVTLGNGFEDIEALSLKFSGISTFKSGITNEGIEELGSFIATKLLNLRQLELSFSDYETISDSGLSKLCYSITSNLSKLQKLTLIFDGCVKITGNGLAEVAFSIGRFLGNLKQLNLSFKGCPQVNASSKMFVKETIPQIKELNIIL